VSQAAAQTPGPEKPAGSLVVVPPPPRRRWRWAAWLLFAVLLGLAGTAAWWEFARPPMVAIAAPWRGPAIEAVYATGVVEAVESARVGTTIAGRIRDLFVDEGDAVRAGQPIAQLDDRQARQRVSDAEARLALTEQELARVAPLAAQGISSVQALQRAQEARDRASALVQIAIRQLEEHRIASPLDGVVMRRPVEPGETVAANATLFEIAATAPLRVAADVDERDIARVKPGARVAIRAEAYPGRAIAATVTNMRARGETATRTFRVEALLPPDSLLLIGMTVDVNIVVAERADALLVPPAAVRHAPSQGGRPGAAHVFRLVDGRAVLTPVVLGAAGPEAIEIREGLAPDARILADPPAGIADGAAVVPAG
jgi:RND family efflux transporter MFP subunit